jgi:hypothetical protein
MTKDYTQFGIENYILKISGVFNYTSTFYATALKNSYEPLVFSKSNVNFCKDFFYPNLRKEFFSNNNDRHPILIRKGTANTPVNLFQYAYNSSTEKAKSIDIIVAESRLDLFENGFGMFSLSLRLTTDQLALATFSDAAFLARNFDTTIAYGSYTKWHEYIENEVLLGLSTRGSTIKVDEYSGSKYKLYMVLDVPQLEDKTQIKALLFDIGTLSRLGSAVGDASDGMDDNYIKKLIKNNSIEVFNNWQGLALLDTYTVVGKSILNADWKKETYGTIYFGIYYYCLFLKYSLFKFNFDIADLDEDRREDFQDFLAKYYFNYVSYNFLPTEIYNKIRAALDIEKELQLLNEKIVAVGQKIQEEQQGRTNKILGIVTVLSSLSSAQPVYDYLIVGQKILGWNVAFYWTFTISIVLLLLGGVAFYVFGKNILKWFKKRKK